MALTYQDRLRAGLAAWLNRARPAQLPPVRWALVWLVMAGRGFGKTRTGAEVTALRMVNRPGIRVALVAQTFADGRDVMVEGESGLLGVLERYYGPDVRKRWNRSLGELVLPNGSRARIYSGERPRQLRGPQHHFAWCDELAWWQYPRETWDALLFGLRLGDDPQIVITTTPRPIKLLRELVAAGDTTVTSGSTLDNRANLPASIVAKLLEQYDGTATGQQELYGLLLGAAEGARWTEELQAIALRRYPLPELDRLVVSVDVATTTEEDSDHTGLAVIGRGPAPELWTPPPAILERAVAAGIPERTVLARPHLYVVHTEAAKLTPTETMERADDLAELYDADLVVLEANNGGDYLPTVLRQVNPARRYKTVHARGKKLERAEPLAQLYEQWRVHHVGQQEQLQDEQLAYTGADNDPSPNVLDAVVHGAVELVPQVAPGRRPRKRKQAKLVTA